MNEKAMLKEAFISSLFVPLKLEDSDPSIQVFSTCQVTIQLHLGGEL